MDERIAGIDTFWLIFAGIFVFFMQAGFGMLEAGSVRAKNTHNILLKNIFGVCAGAIVWWAFGYGVAYGGSNPFIGSVWYKGYHYEEEHAQKNPAAEHSSWHFDNGNFFSMGYQGVDHRDGEVQGQKVEFVDNKEDPTGAQFAAWWFQFVFAAAASTIVSGALAERVQLVAYLCYTVVITGLIYPVVVHWVWDPYGWASAFNAYGTDGAFFGGCIDFAGSGVVHMTGGVMGLVGAAIAGPRAGRFDMNRKPMPMPGHSTVLQVLGTFFLWVGWYGFNPGSTLMISSAGAAQTAARVVVTTTLSAAAGGLTVVCLNRVLARGKMWDVGRLCNGVLAGLVSITAGCAVVTTWAAVVIGVGGGLVYSLASWLLLNKLHIDDPLDVFPVHGACGFYGVLVTGFFATDYYTESYYSWASNDEYHWDKKYAGVFYGGTHVLGAAIVTLVAEVAWVGTISTILFFTLKATKLLRVSMKVEEMGLDLAYINGAAHVAAHSSETQAIAAWPGGDNELTPSVLETGRA